MTHRVVGTAVRVSVVALALAAGVTHSSRAQGQIAIGQVVQSQLTGASAVNADGKRYAMWTFMGNAGQYVQIDMQSTEIDCYLILQDQNGNQLSFNDDGGGGLNARIQFTLPYAGVYRIMAMSFRTSGVMFGTYSLSVSGGNQMGGQPMGQPMIQQMANPSGVVGTIAVGQQAQGVLSMGDARYDNKPFQAYSFQCTAGLAFQLNILSSWDNYALIFDPMGNVVARDDDSGGSLQARINYTCPMNGTYRLAVSVFSTSTTPGPYTMQLLGTAGPTMSQPMVQPMNTNPSGVVGTIAVGQQAQGVLSMGDARYDNKPFQAYNFQCTTGLGFQLNILSSWDNYALIFDPVGNVVARDDDSGGSLQARINYTCPMDGIYRLAVSVFSTSTTPGPYTMQVQGTTGPGFMQPSVQPMAMSAGGMIAPPSQMATIAFGQQLQGRLEAGDRQMQDSTFADVWMFQGTGGQRVTIDLTSENFDSYLQLLDASGNRLAEDDDSGGNLNARISYTLPANAQYQIVVNNYGSSRRIGLYTLWVH